MMRFNLLLVLLFIQLATYAQQVIARGAEVAVGKLVRVGDPFHPDPKFKARVVRTEDGIIRKENKKENNEHVPVASYPEIQQKTDNALQTNFSGSAPDAYSVIEGMDFSRVCPADPTLAVGPNHIVQMINDRYGTALQIWDKSGKVVVAKKLLSDITGIQGLGDPVALYDQLANRYLLTEFQDSANGLIVAVSATGDPAGKYYSYLFSTRYFPDYPKYAIWNNAYYAKSNDFGGPTTTHTIYAFDRAAMLSGKKTIGLQKITLPFNISHYSMCPVGLSGTAIPPAGSGGLFAYMSDNTWTGSKTDSIGLMEFKVDFANPSNSTLTATNFEVAAYNPWLSGVQQPNYLLIDPLVYIVMNQPVYRNFSSSQSLALAFTVNQGRNLAGIRWFELKKTSGAWAINQQSTYAPPDAQSRWISSININGRGDIGLAYNLSGVKTGPSIRFTGRHSTDALNTMTVTETTLQEGTSYSACYNRRGQERYGDYNHLVVDPSDDNTFWFTAMYNKTYRWSTKIGSFNLDAGITSSSSPAQSAVDNEGNEMLRKKTVFHIYPNPVHDRLTVNLPANESKSLLQVMDISGRTVLSNNISGSTYSLNTLSLKAGVYLLKVSNTNMVRYMKFVKE